MLKLLGPNKCGEKGDKIKRLRAHFSFSFLQGRIAQLQQEKEEIPTEFGKKLTEEEDQQIMRPMHEMKV
jgi:hypothetical protein